MGLKLPVVFKRSNSDDWYAKKETPKDIWDRRDELEAVGIKVPRVTLRSMETSSKKDSLVAEVKFLSDLAKDFSTWRETLKNGPVELNDHQQWAVVTAISRRLLESHRKSNIKAAEWGSGRAETVWRKLLGVPRGGLAAATRKLIDEELKEQGIVATTSSKIAVHHKLIGFDMQSAQDAAKGASRLRPPRPNYPDVGDLERVASTLAHRGHTGDYREPEYLQARPTKQAIKDGLRYTFDNLVETWQTHEREGVFPGAASFSKYRQQARLLADFMRHDDALFVTEDDAERLHKFLLEPTANEGEPYASKQVRDVLANLRTLYAKAVRARKLKVNPFEHIVPQRPKKRNRLKRRGFTDVEAKTILGAARKEQDTGRRCDSLHYARAASIKRLWPKCRNQKIS